MAARDKIKEWWTEVLLGQQQSAHPVFGHDIEVTVDGDAVTLSGEVETPEEAKTLECEARRLPTIDTVINRLTVTGFTEDRHMQTVIAIFPDSAGAELACQNVEAWKMRQGDKPDLLDNADEAREYLQERAHRAEVPDAGINPYLGAVQQGKVLLVDRVPEDEALRVISALEGTPAESVRTLPPEPVESVRR